jgi:hypothetical protein
VAVPAAPGSAGRASSSPAAYGDDRYDWSLWSSRPVPRILGHEEGLPCLISRVRFPPSRTFVT